MSKQFKGSLMLLLGAIIWGGALVAQSEGMNYIKPHTYSALRFLLALIVLLPFCVLVNSKGLSKTFDKQTIIGGTVCGLFLFVGNALQQYGLVITNPGKGGFITSLYLIFVPLFNLLIFKKKIHKKVIIAILLAMCGFYLLCIKGQLNIAVSDLLILGCAILFALQILSVDYYTKLDLNPIKLTFYEFFTAFVLSTICMFIFDDININSIMDAKWSILYVGVLSGGLGYTLQMYGQRDTDPTIATLLMSLESVFSLIFEMLLLHNIMSVGELLGCLLVFIAVIIVEIPIGDKNVR